MNLMFFAVISKINNKMVLNAKKTVDKSEKILYAKFVF